MASIFDKDPAEKPEVPIYGRERIESEIAHLKKPKSVRDLKAEKYAYARFIVVTLVLAIIGLYVLDPILFAYHRGDAIRAYLYLHNYGSDAKAQALASTRILTADEILTLNHRTGSFQDYYPSAQAATDKADEIIAYLQNVHNLHIGKYDQLTLLNKVRFYLFVQTGIPLPTEWSALNPSVGE
jgi:hypothetical protein